MQNKLFFLRLFIGYLSPSILGVVILSRLSSLSLYNSELLNLLWSSKLFFYFHDIFVVKRLYIYLVEHCNIMHIITKSLLYNLHLISFWSHTKHGILLTEMVYLIAYLWSKNPSSNRKWKPWKKMGGVRCQTFSTKSDRIGTF